SGRPGIRTRGGSYADPFCAVVSSARGSQEPMMSAPSLTGPETMLRGGSWVGRSVRRREDGRLLRGTGRFLDDIELPGMVHAQFVRSTIAAGTFADLRLDRVREMSGVCAAFTATDLDLAPMAPSLDRPLAE